MPFNYEKLYKDTPDALGEPTQIFVDFFNTLDRKNIRVLDIGCGQGRDALFIARLGHSVVGVDVSAHGIQDLLLAADKERLPIEGHVADITGYAPEGLFDLILVDRTLHMLSKQARCSVLANLLDHVTDKGCVLIADEASNISDFAAVISGHSMGWQKFLAKRGYLFIRKT